ncbi:MAG: hypothetical protein KA293_12410, partial [Bacteroidia bacterium]|nr:hypothetical protein [Bacteroidia bacterium]
MIFNRLSLLNTSFVFLFFAFSMPIFAQEKDPDANKTIQQVEKELAPMARMMLNDTSTTKKIELNKEFIVRMTNLLAREESYDYPFDSLKTISHLRPDDNSFRIFT